MNLQYLILLDIVSPQSTFAHGWITTGFTDDTLIVAEGDMVEGTQNQTNAALIIISKKCLRQPTIGDGAVEPSFLQFYNCFSHLRQYSWINMSFESNHSIVK